MLVATAIVGVISPSGYEVGPFLSVEQAALSQIVARPRRTGVFAWYALVGSFAVALGAVVGGGLAQWLRRFGFTPLESYQVIVLAYGAIGIALAILFTRLSPAIEPDRKEGLERDPAETFLGLHESRKVVFKLAALFGLDAFAGGFVIQSLLAYWFHVRFGFDPAKLGAIFFGANVLAGISALSATRLAARFGLVNTMVFTHVPSNVLLMLVPLMPNAILAIIVLLLRFGISQMDVPTRQAYTVSVVAPDERSAAAGVTGIARTIGAALSPMIAGPMLTGAALMSLPFFVAGALKLCYDFLLYRNFRSVSPKDA